MTQCPQFWLALFTGTSWREFKEAGGSVVGFNKGRFGVAKKIRKGDFLICYLTKVSRFVGILKIKQEATMGGSKIWQEGDFPLRVGVEPWVEVSVVDAIPIADFRTKLKIFQNLKNPNAWTMWVRSAPKLWPEEDGRAIEQALREVQAGSGEAFEPLDFAKAEKTAKVPRKRPAGGPSAVKTVIRRAKSLANEDNPVPPDEKLFSYNKVTGYSLNFPIYSTCSPTKVCVKTCYFARGRNAFSNSLKHQLRNLDSCRNSPETFAAKVIREYDNQTLTFLRWNGGGDLFPESVEVLNLIGKKRPDLIIWVVTRKPELAAAVEHFSNIYIHFSLDRSSLERREQFLALKPKSRNYFFSYQCDQEEKPAPGSVKDTAVLFFDNYAPTGKFDWMSSDIVCPLNKVTNIANTCEKCRRCFNGEAVLCG
jgi:hypothetical protein